jgi:hypothetical protein
MKTVTKFVITLLTEMALKSMGTCGRAGLTLLAPVKSW